MRKKKWVTPFLENEDIYLIDKIDFLDDRSVYVEIGMGMGDFICESAHLNPDIYYIGLEKEDTCVARAVIKANDLKLDNVNFILADASNIEELFMPDSIDLIYLHFSDPWPKKRNHKRRLTYPSFLNLYEKLLKKDGIIIVKSDNVAFFDDSLEYFKQANYTLLETDRNYYVENEPMTGYQRKFYEMNQPIYYAKYKVDKV